MNFIWSGLFWGVILVLFGVSVILKSVLKIDIPIFKIVFAFFLIYFGVKLLLGTSAKNKDTVFFNKFKMEANSSKDEYNVIFGSGGIDLREITPQEGKINKEINIVFGSGSIYLPSDVPVVVKIETVFGESRYPDGKTVFFGDHLYQNNVQSDSNIAIFLEVNVVFGSVEIINDEL